MSRAITRAVLLAQVGADDRRHQTVADAGGLDLVGEAHDGAAVALLQLVMPFVRRRPPRPPRASSTMRSGVDSTGVISIQPPPPLPFTRMPVAVRWKFVGSVKLVVHEVLEHGVDLVGGSVDRGGDGYGPCATLSLTGHYLMDTLGKNPGFDRELALETLLTVWGAVAARA